MSSPALAENTNAAPAAAEPVVAAKKAKTSVEGKASPTTVSYTHLTLPTIYSV